MRNRRITMPQFPAWTACRPPSQARLCHCTLRPVTNRPERTFGSLRYAFGGDHPSQTTRHAMSPQTRGLGPKQPEGRISTAAPRALARALQCLRPILHTGCPGAMQSCSKGSRGLFVPLRVIGIFTDSTISPGSQPRQWEDRCTIRAGRNLPDKEFRYLRTVIVTAAVYRGFNSRLFTGASIQGFASPLTSPLNLPAPGRCQALYFVLRLRKALCFC